MPIEISSVHLSQRHSGKHVWLGAVSHAAQLRNGELYCVQSIAGTVRRRDLLRTAELHANGVRTAELYALTPEPRHDPNFPGPFIFRV